MQETQADSLLGDANSGSEQLDGLGGCSAGVGVSVQPGAEPARGCQVEWWVAGLLVSRAQQLVIEGNGGMDGWELFTLGSGGSIGGDAEPVRVEVAEVADLGDPGQVGD